MEMEAGFLKKPLVLIVDDNPANIQVVGNHLVQNNIDISMATDGNKAIIAAKAKTPDLILLDIMMPEVDGYQVARQLKADPQTKDIPIIFLTAKNTTEDVIKGFSMGAVDYIVKPFNSSELLVRVHNHLELKKYRDLVLAKNLQLENLNLEKNELLGIAAHDLKNPIYNISMLAKVILEEELEKEEIAEFAGDIVKTSEKMLDLIKNLLDINAIEEGRIKICIEDTNLDELIKTSMKIYKDRAAAKSIELNYENLSKDSKAKADSNAMHQVLDNLISNAIKYSPLEKSIYISLFDSGEEIICSIKDEGPGLDEKDKSKLFQKFSKLSPQPTAGEHSTGLGLSIVKKYLDLMNGSIEVETELGMGCNFIVKLRK